MNDTTAMNIVSNEVKSAQIATVEARWTLARIFPRNEQVAKVKILDSAKRLRMAENAHYLYKRSGKEVKGITIRAAEEIARIWGGLDFGYRTLSETKEETEAEAYCIDLESNTKQSRAFRVSHYRHTKRGSYLLTDPRDVYEMVANRGMRVVRACIKSMIPEDILDEFEDACDRTIYASIGDLPSARTKMAEAFSGIGVEKKSIEAFLNKKIGDSNQYEILKLRRIYTSINEGWTDSAEWFGAELKQYAASKLPERPKPEEEEKRIPPPPPPAALPTPAAQRPPADHPPAEQLPAAPPPSAGPAVPAGTVQAESITKTTIGRIIGAYNRLGIGKDLIERKMGAPMEEITKADVDFLRNCQRLIRAGKETAESLGFREAAAVVDETKQEAEEPAQSQQETVFDELRSRIDRAESGDDLDKLEDEVNDAVTAEEISELGAEELSGKILERIYQINQDHP